MMTGGSQHGPGSSRDNAVCVVADYFWQAKRAIDALDVVFDGGAHGDLSTAKIDAMLDDALNAEQAVTALERGRPREILKDRAASVDRAAVQAAAHRACAPRTRQCDGELQGWRGRGLGADPIGHGLPGGGRGSSRVQAPTT